MTIYVGVTDNEWFYYLRELNPDEVNFWRPSGRSFKALEPNGMFLFKLHSPLNYIVGGGFFLRHVLLPLSVAWNAFGIKNGVADYKTLVTKITSYRNVDSKKRDPLIGCTILTRPFFLKENDWIPVPPDWKPNIVQGKTYSLAEETGKRLYEDILGKLRNHQIEDYVTPDRYGKEQIVRPRLGQSSFKALITESYDYKCAITGERILPVLEAAHIKPYSESGPHDLENGLLIRRDFHTLFDRGYLTVTDDLHVEVSKSLRDDFGNGRYYYAYHGRKLVSLPLRSEDRPGKKYLRWHNDKKFLA